MLNFGVTGYNITQVVERLRTLGLRYEPDLLLYGYVLNDPQGISREGEIIKALRDFEEKRYTNPTLMKSILRSTGTRSRWRVLKGDCDFSDWPALGLVRVQWDGPWCNDGVPIAARYRHTHWVGSRRHGDRPEIHPSQLYWWREDQDGSTTHYLMSLLDASQRFVDRDQFGRSPGTGSVPWPWSSSNRCSSRWHLWLQR